MQRAKPFACTWLIEKEERTPEVIPEASRVGPELPEFNRRYDEMARQTDGKALVAQAADLDRYTKEEALALFLCSPQSLTAVNKDVKFTPYATTFELAEAEVTERHWSLR